MPSQMLKTLRGSFIRASMIKELDIWEDSFHRLFVVRGWVNKDYAHHLYSTEDKADAERMMADLAKEI